MITRRRLLLLAGITAMVALAGGVWVLWPRDQTVITQENAAKIKEGMTLAEVEVIQGGPARNESSGLWASERNYASPRSE